MPNTGQRTSTLALKFDLFIFYCPYMMTCIGNDFLGSIRYDLLSTYCTRDPSTSCGPAAAAACSPAASSPPPPRASQPRRGCPPASRGQPGARPASRARAEASAPSGDLKVKLCCPFLQLHNLCMF